MHTQVSQAPDFSFLSRSYTRRYATPGANFYFLLFKKSRWFYSFSRMSESWLFLEQLRPRELPTDELLIPLCQVKSLPKYNETEQGKTYHFRALLGEPMRGGVNKTR